MEGWHTGKERIDSGSMVERVNFVADQVGNIGQPGIRAIVDRLLDLGPVIDPEALIDGCLNLLGQLRLQPTSRQHLVDQLIRSGEIRTDNPAARQEAEQVILRTLKMISSTREYQFA